MSKTQIIYASRAQTGSVVADICLYLGCGNAGGGANVRTYINYDMRAVKGKCMLRTDG
jgi:hypothetical protein